MRKTFPVLLALVLVLILAVPAGAADASSNEVVENITSLAFYNYEGHAAWNPEETLPGDEIIIPLVKLGFEDEYGSVIEWDEDTTLGPTVKQLEQNHITANIYIAKGAAAIRDIRIVSYKPTKRVRAQAAIRVRFVEDHVSTQELRYEFSLELLHNKKETGVGETFGGLLHNPVIDLEYDNDYVHIADGNVARCLKSVDNIDVDIGSGVSIKTNLVEGEKYYGRVRYEENLQQDPILKAYDAIVCVYKVNTINLQTGGTPVRISLDDNVNYYVYNQFGKFIGMSQDNLPYSTRYYFATHKITIDIEPNQLMPYDNDQHMSAAVSSFTEGLLKN